MQVDHIIPKHNYESVIMSKEMMVWLWIPKWLMHLWLDDLNHKDNLMPSCRSCNWYKGSMPLETFRKELWLIVGRLNERTSIYKIARRFGLVEETNIEIVFYFEKVNN